MSKGYATPVLKPAGENRCWVYASTTGELVGGIQPETGGNWSSLVGQRQAGLYPHLQAAAEALLKRAGYEVSGS